MSYVRLAGWLAVILGKNSDEHYTQTVPPNSFIPAILIGTIDFYHFIPLSLTLTLPRGHTISAMQNLMALFSQHFSSDQDEIWCCDEAIQT